MPDNEFIKTLDLSQFGEMTCEQMRDFCNKTAEEGISMKDVLYLIALLSRQRERTNNRLQEHIEKGFHER